MIVVVGHPVNAETDSLPICATDWFFGDGENLGADGHDSGFRVETFDVNRIHG